MNKLLLSATLALMCALASSCDDVMGDIYSDSAAEAPEYGFIRTETPTTPGKIYVDATSYTDWVYLDFTNLRAETLPVGAEAPSRWDLAVHRYDAKTNGGEVSVQGSDQWVADEWTTETIITDMSHMMDGWLEYAESSYNPLLSRWLDVDKSSMPPTYTLSGITYVLRTSDGRTVSLRLANFMNDEGVKGYLTIEYHITSR